MPLAVGTALSVRMVVGLLGEAGERKRIRRDVERHFDEVYLRE